MDGLRTFLRYGQIVVELRDAPIVIGRASSCDIVLDDELASREHCRIAVDGDRVLVTDLGSKNGVLVNGVPVSGEQALHHGDCVTVGTAQLVLMRQHRAPKMTPAAGAQRPSRRASAHEPTTRGDILEILHRAAATSLDEGDLLGAETTARNLFVVLRANASRGRDLPRGALDDAIAIAIELGERSGEARWLEQALDATVAFRSTLSPAHARRLAEVASRVGAPRRALDEYLRSARDVGGESEPSLVFLAGL